MPENCEALPPESRLYQRLLTSIFERIARDDGERLIFMVSSAIIGSNVES
jgi:hypothetical protein